METITRLWLYISLSVRGRLECDERGAALVEYALLVTLVAVAAVAAITSLGGGITAQFKAICNKVAPAGTTC